MSEPKISRRCPTCGASIRDLAFFCPQCGGKLDPPKPQALESASIHDTAEEVIDPSQTITEAAFRARANIHDTTEEVVDSDQTITEAAFQARAKPYDTAEEAIDSNQTITEADFRARANIHNATEEVIDLKPASEGVRKPVRARVMGEGSKIQRVTSKARDVEDDVKQRVQKFREISSVVIDEASYDPSLRFILVAAVLFILFVVIVVLNKIIG